MEDASCENIEVGVSVKLAIPDKYMDIADDIMESTGNSAFPE